MVGPLFRKLSVADVIIAFLAESICLDEIAEASDIILELAQFGTGKIEVETTYFGLCQFRKPSNNFIFKLFREYANNCQFLVLKIRLYVIAAEATVFTHEVSKDCPSRYDLSYLAP